MGFSIRRWLQNAGGGGKTVDIDCRALFEAAENYRVRELAFWCCVNLIAAALGRCDFRTYERGREIRGGDYYAWNIAPNPNQNSTAFLHKLASRLYQDNEALIVPVPQGGEGNQEYNYLFVADSWDAEAPAEWPDRPNRYSAIQVGDVSYKASLPEYRVLHLRLNHCDVRPVLNGLYDAYVKLLRAAMDNYGWVNGQHWKVHVSQMASGQEGWAEQFQKMLEAQIKPFLTSGTSILPELDGYSYENAGKSFETGRDASHIKNLINDVFDFTANAFLIPPVLLRGQVEGTADAVSRFLTNCVDPLADQISEEFTRKRYGYQGWRAGRTFRVDTGAIGHFSLFENAGAVEKLIGSGYSYNDVQRATGGPEIDEPWANGHFLTKNFARAEDILTGSTEGERTT